MQNPSVGCFPVCASRGTTTTHGHIVSSWPNFSLVTELENGKVFPLAFLFPSRCHWGRRVSVLYLFFCLKMERMTKWTRYARLLNMSRWHHRQRVIPKRMRCWATGKHSIHTSPVLLLKNIRFRTLFVWCFSLKPIVRVVRCRERFTYSRGHTENELRPRQGKLNATKRN